MDVIKREEAKRVASGAGHFRPTSDELGLYPTALYKYIEASASPNPIRSRAKWGTVSLCGHVLEGGEHVSLLQ